MSTVMPESPGVPARTHAAWIASFHRGALLQAAEDAAREGGVAASVRQLWVRDHHRLALARAEVEVQGVTLADALRDGAAWSIREALARSTDPEGDARSLITVARMNGAR